MKIFGYKIPMAVLLVAGLGAFLFWKNRQAQAAAAVKAYNVAHPINVIQSPTISTGATQEYPIYDSTGLPA